MKVAYAALEVSRDDTEDAAKLSHADDCTITDSSGCCGLQCLFLRDCLPDSLHGVGVDLLAVNEKAL